MFTLVKSLRNAIILLFFCNSSRTDAYFGFQEGKTKGFEVKHGFSLNVANGADGFPEANGFSYLAGKLGPGPTYYYHLNKPMSNGDDDGEDIGTSLATLPFWSQDLTELAINYASAVAVGVGVATVYYILIEPLLWGSNLSMRRSGRMKNMTNGNFYLSENGSGDDSMKKIRRGEEKAAKSDKTIGESSRRRKRRAVGQSSSSLQGHRMRSLFFPQSDADVTHLAITILNSIASLECLEEGKTVCQLGTRGGRN